MQYLNMHTINEFQENKWTKHDGHILALLIQKVQKSIVNWYLHAADYKLHFLSFHFFFILLLYIILYSIIQYTIHLLYMMYCFVYRKSWCFENTFVLFVENLSSLNMAKFVWFCTMKRHDQIALGSLLDKVFETAKQWILSLKLDEKYEINSMFFTAKTNVSLIAC